MNFIEYKKGLPLSAEIYWKFNPPPTTHQEWAESFNKIGEINEIVVRELNKLQKKSDDEPNN